MTWMQSTTGPTTTTIHHSILPTSCDQPRPRRYTSILPAQVPPCHLQPRPGTPPHRPTLNLPTPGSIITIWRINSIILLLRRRRLRLLRRPTNHRRLERPRATPHPPNPTADQEVSRVPVDLPPSPSILPITPLHMNLPIILPRLATIDHDIHIPAPRASPTDPIRPRCTSSLGMI